MVRLFSLFLYNLILLINFLFNFRKSNNLIYNLKNKLESKNYLKLKIEKSFVNFYAPNEICKWRYTTIFTKEPETLDWINNFVDNNDLIFWDIGANVGIYSIYSAIKYNNIKVVAFEPSTSNLRVLSRNISINNFSNKIIINQTPLFDKDFGFHKLNEEGFDEGGALNAFSVDYGYDGKKFNPKNSYSIYGTSINFLLSNNILEIPDYIKIDVDGIEDLILKGGEKYLKHEKIKSILIELNESFVDQTSNSINILKKNNFELLYKKHSKEFDNSEKYSSIYNYVFKKKN